MASKSEYKYLVPNRWLNDIRSQIAPFVESDKHAVRRDPREYTVRSIYWDSPGLVCYHEKLEGIKIRRKYRIRGYDVPSPDSPTFLEIKRKCVNLVSKTRTRVPWCDVGALLYSSASKDDCISNTGNQSDGRSAQSFLYYYHRCGLVPTVLVVYDREAFHGRFDPTFRVTFDKNLRSAACPSLDRLFSEEGLRPAFRNHFVLEVKFFRGQPAWIRSVIERYQLSRMAISKYAICLSSHGPVNRLSPKLLRSFPAADRTALLPERKTA